MSLSDPRWRELLENYPVERYPDYEPGKPPQLEALHRASYLDELESIWGKCWGCQGIGKLREVALVKCDPAYEGHPYGSRHPDFFLLRHNPKPDLDLFIEHQLAYARTLAACGVKVHWMEVEGVMGAYGPMHKFFKFLTSIGCPIIGAVTGTGISEAGSVVPVAKGVLLAGLSCALNPDGLDQITPILRRCGVKEIQDD